MSPQLAGSHSLAWSWIAQLWYGNKSLHYEAWLRARQGVLEIGLHFEADALTNARLLAAFRARERAVHRGLGADARIESWDKGWTRVWEPIPLRRLDADFQRQVSARLIAYVRTLEPLLRDELPADVAWDEPRTSRHG